MDGCGCGRTVRKTVCSFMGPLKSTDCISPDPSVMALVSGLQQEPASGEIVGTQGNWLGSSRQTLSGQALLKKILGMSLIFADDWVGMPEAKRAALERCSDAAALLDLLVT